MIFGRVARALATTALVGLGLTLFTAAPAQALPGSDPNRPAQNTPGYTTCWFTEENFGTVDQIDPLDKQTWPVYITPSLGQPGYEPHTGASSEGSAIWTSVDRSDPRANFAVPGWDVRQTNCPATATRPYFSGTASMLDEEGATATTVSAALSPGQTWSYNPGPAPYPTPGDLGVLAAQPGDVIQASTLFEVTLPAFDTVLGYDGLPETAGPASTEYRFLPPQVNAMAFSTAPPENVSVSCTGADRVFGRGSTVSISCLTTATVPNFTFNDWSLAGTDEFFAGFSTFLATSINVENRYVAGTPGGFVGAWYPEVTLTAGSPVYMGGPADEWLPTVEDKRFRVAVEDTLTVTPEGLLTGAAWNEGDVAALDTFITNVPTGGTLTPEGNLDFTSEEVGDFGFNYYLQDPTSGIRSRDALGQIEVFADAVEPPVVVDPPVIVEPPVVVDPPVVVEPPVVLLPPTVTAETPVTLVPLDDPRPEVLASTGLDAGPILLVSVCLLALGALALFGRPRKKGRVTAPDAVE